ncbi:hypothetical protein D9756_002807 [Leucocoprinus leucothites]|uniref:Uncharacterized protein n=1 Tax=Leucocoprinus leucothites TaxID=201217 RepID=A0A8H5GBT8_9AGAR|nr:hypothetical protein D9756_002807 [Leucoagaricus leucothites]
MTTINDFPVEILDAISNEVASVSESDLRSWRSTCKLIDNLLTPKVLATIYINFADWRNTRSLVDLASGRNRVHIFARKLIIRCLAPGTGDLGLPQVQMNANPRGSYSYPNQPSGPDVAEAASAVLKYLHEALRHFRDLEIVDWCTHGYDITGINTPVMDLLHSQEHLRTLFIDMSRGVSSPLPDISQLAGLGHLAFIFPQPHIRVPSMFLGAAQAIHNSPELIFLHIFLQQSYYTPEESANIDEMYKQMAQLQHIHTLMLYVPTMASLNRLSVLNNLRSLKDIYIYPEEAHAGMEDLWRLLKEHNIHLKLISFNMADMAQTFPDYLMSYSGAEELILSNYQLHWVDPEADVTAIATKFFKALVERHAATLRVLKLKLFSRKSFATWGRVDRLHYLLKLPALTKLEIDLTADEKLTIMNGTSTEYVCPTNYCQNRTRF